MNASRGSLLIVGTSIVLSVGGAIALIWPVLEHGVVQASETAASTSRLAPELRQKGWDFWTVEIENLSNELKAERVRLKAQADGIEQRRARLAAEEKEFERARAEIDAMRRQISERVVEIEADEAKNIRSLAATYAKLTPRSAVSIFREMDDVTVVKILASMKPDNVGPIFEEMSRASAPDESLAKRAALLSEKLRLMRAARALP